MPKFQNSVCATNTHTRFNIICRNKTLLPQTDTFVHPVHTPVADLQQRQSYSETSRSLWCQARRTPQGDNDRLASAAWGLLSKHLSICSLIWAGSVVDPKLNPIPLFPYRMAALFHFRKRGLLVSVPGSPVLAGWLARRVVKRSAQRAGMLWHLLWEMPRWMTTVGAGQGPLTHRGNRRQMFVCTGRAGFNECLPVLCREMLATSCCQAAERHLMSQPWCIT